MKKKVALLLSGGVDSSVALHLLLNQGYEVTAFYLKIWLEDELSFLGTCPWEEDLHYVRQVCDQAGVPLEILSLQKEYHEEIVSYTISEIKSGRTPNPDSMCNQRIKFGAFLKKIDASFDYIATGHYAQLKKVDGKSILYMAPDEIKDQTYFLSHLTQEQLNRSLFPIGHLSKSQVRELAQKYNLPNKDRKDSQGICFLGKLKFQDFVAFHVGHKEGDLIEYETGKKMGTHKGFWYYTIGQRQGIGLGGGPWYVVAKDTVKNIVYISSQYYTTDKMRDILHISSCNWIIEPPLDRTVQIKLRHGPHMHKGTITKQENTADTYTIKLNERDQGISAGQFAVLYDDTLCLGGGIIT